jgi:hypothetical protein
MARVLKDWLNSYLEYTKKSEPPLLYKSWVAVSVIAGCLRRKCKLQLGTLRFYPNLYIVLVGPSGKCRKGTAMGDGESFLKDLGIKIASTSITREALIHQLKTSSDTSITADGKMSMHSSLTVFSKELTVFLGYNNQQLMADLTDFYDCADQWEYRTKNMGTDDISGVWVNLIGATTPDLLQTTLPRDAIGGGLTSRIIFVYENKKDHTEPFPVQTRAELELCTQLTTDLEKISMLQGEFAVTDSFIDVWIDWYTRVDSSPPPFEDHRFSGYFERRPTHMYKLCMIFSASRSDSMKIDVIDFERALDLLVRTEKMMPFTFSGLGKSTNSESLNRMLTIVAAKKRIKISELQGMFYNDADAKTLEGMIATMNLMDYAKTTIEGHEQFIVYNEGQTVRDLPT